MKWLWVVRCVCVCEEEREREREFVCACSILGYLVDSRGVSIDEVALGGLMCVCTCVCVMEEGGEKDREKGRRESVCACSVLGYLVDLREFSIDELVVGGSVCV